MVEVLLEPRRARKASLKPHLGTAERGAGFVTRRALPMGATASIRVLGCNVLNNMENGRKGGHVQETRFYSGSNGK